MINKKLPIQESIDILYVEQEVSPSENTVINEVLSANEKELNYLKKKKNIFLNWKILMTLY